VCTCGVVESFNVSLGWDDSLRQAVPYIAEPIFADMDFEQFGEVTAVPLTLNLAATLATVRPALLAAHRGRGFRDHERI
jgi:hypothetical protein